MTQRKMGTHRDLIELPNPKRHMDSATRKEARLFPYYAGFSSTFAEQTLRSLRLAAGSVVLDPWNGSGTTAIAAARCGLGAIGGDRNPAMVIVAKATFVSALDMPSVLPLSHAIVERLDAHPAEVIADDPLTTWLAPQSASAIRTLEAEINHTLVAHDRYQWLGDAQGLGDLSSLAAFFYVALFRTTRRLLSDFIPTNPTWTKTPTSTSHRKRPAQSLVRKAFCLKSKAWQFAYRTAVRCLPRTPRSFL